MSVLSDACTFVQSTVAAFEANARTASKACVERVDGRRREYRDHPVSRPGSYVYAAYRDEHVLYVGETSKSIKRRFKSDGDGAHCKANEEWYRRMTHASFWRLENDDERYRKLIEAALIIGLGPSEQT